MSAPKRTNRVIVASLALVAFGGLSVHYVLRHTRPIDVERRGEVVAVDVANRQAQITFVHPRNGEAFLVSSEVPVSCTIEHEGRAVALQDIVPGTQVLGRGQLFPLTRKIVATHVMIERLPTRQVEASEAVSPPAAP